LYRSGSRRQQFILGHLDAGSAGQLPQAAEISSLQTKEDDETRPERSWIARASTGTAGVARLETGPAISRRSLARVLRRRGMEDAGPRNLGSDQEGRDDSRHADESQELIH